MYLNPRQTYPRYYLIHKHSPLQTGFWFHKTEMFFGGISRYIIFCIPPVRHELKREY